MSIERINGAKMDVLGQKHIQPFCTALIDQLIFGQIYL